MRAEARSPAAVLRTAFTMLALIPAAAASPPAPPTGPPALDPGVARATPSDAVRSLLTLVRRDLDAVARRDRAAARDAIEQLAWHVSARESIAADLGFGLDSADGREVLRRQAESWASVLAFYVDQLDVSRAIVVPGATQDEHVVYLPATSEVRDLLVRFSLRRVAGEWRVKTVRIDPAGAASSQPTRATQPSTAPAAG